MAVSASRLFQHYNGTGLVRALNEQRILEALVQQGPSSRAGLARETGLSKPTVSSVIRYLEAAGLVREQGRLSGSIGRPSTLYEAVSRAGYVFGADVGGTKVRAGVADPYGETLSKITEPTSDPRDGLAIVEQLRELFARLVQDLDLDRQHVWAAGFAVPGVYDPETDSVSAAANAPGLQGIRLAAELREAFGIQVAIENDVNLAAVGERWRGLAEHRQHFAAISIGTGIGMGIILNGELYRGSRGAAGEIDHLPVGASPFDHDPRHGSLESATAGPAILERLRERISAGDRTILGSSAGVPDIFTAADEGDSVASELIDQEARVIAVAIAAVASVLDPELVVLGGGVGANPGLLDPVRAYVAKLSPRPLEIQLSGLGDEAAYFGAISVALRAARQELVAQMAGAR